MSINIYKDYIENILQKSFPDELMIKYFGRIPKYRYDTFTYSINYLNNLNINDTLDKKINITELGTSRSFVDGAYEGCNSDDSKYWEPLNPSKWDWGAGCFTKIFSECLKEKNIVLNTVDIEQNHINRCKIMTNNNNNINYHISSSENYLINCKEKSIDLLYLDTGDVMPVEPTAQLHLREAEIIVKNNILKDKGIILIDDVKNLAPKLSGEESNYGKAKYSIPYFLKNGYYIVIDEYQVILKKYIDIYTYLENNINIKDNEIIIECGGHIGTDTLKLLNLFNKNNLHCIEANISLIEKNLNDIKNKNSNLILHNFGLSDVNEIKQFYIDTDPKGDAGASSLLKANSNEGLSHLSKIEKSISIECKTLDTFINENNIKKIYLMWLDVEQYEYNILKSCSTESLSNIKYIYTEVNFKELRQNGKLYNDVYNLLINNNFKEIFKTPQGDDNFNWQANVLFENINYIN